MKKINLTHYTLPEKTSWLKVNNTYTLLLGNELRCSFSNETKCKKFLAETNRFLNLQLQEINQIYIQTFSEYRNLYFIIDFEQNIESSLNDVDKLFKRVFFNNHSENSNCFVFMHMFRLIDELKLVIEKLIEFNQTCNNYARANILASLLLRTENCIKSLMNYGKTNHDINRYGTENQDTV